MHVKKMDLPNDVSLNPVLINELLLDSLPHPAMVIGRDRVVLSANRCAREAGARVGGYCWRDFGQGKYIPEAERKFLAANPAAVPPGGTRCTFCQADTALQKNRPENNPELEAFDRVWDTWWVPIGNDLYLHYAIDMTAQREAETILRRSREELEKLVAERTLELRRSEKRYRTLFNDARDALFTATPEGKVIEANPAALELFGYAREELSPDFNALELYARKEDRDHFRKALEEKGEVKDFEVGLCRKDGGVIDCLVTVSPIASEKGERLGYQGIVHDISNMKRAQRRHRIYAEKLERSNRELEDFAFIASHDLQEPLRKIQTFSERLMTRCREKLDQQEMDYLERLRNAAARMKALVGALLNLSRINTRGQPFMTVNLGELVREVIAGFEEPVHEYVEIDELPAILADPAQMLQLFQNLIGNALKFRKKEKPSIRISSRPVPGSKGRESANRPQWHEIRVEDDGIGFDMEHASRIFAPFQRLHGRSEYPGQGMGLAICKRVVERHGGSITAHGTPGEGARFIIRLPSSPCAAEAAEVDPD